MSNNKGVKFINITTMYQAQIVKGIEVEPGVTTVTFEKGRIYDFSNEMKQFPDVTKLVFQTDRVEFENYLFPNVKEVVSECPNVFTSNVYKKRKYGKTTLLNAFCKKPGEEIDMAGVAYIAPNAFTNCMSTNLVGLDSKVETSTYTNRMNTYFGLLGITNIQADTFRIGSNIYGINPYADSIHVENCDKITWAINGSIVNTGVDFVQKWRANNIWFEKIIVKGAGRIDFRNLTVKAKNIEFDENEFYTSIDGIVYSKDLKTCISCPKEKEGIVRIKEGTKNILDDAFKNCPWISEVFIPDSVERIGEAAFFGCHSLKKVQFGKNVSLIGKKAFWGCSFEKVEIPKKILRIPNEAFFMCSQLKHVDLGNVQSIGSSAFSYCKDMSDLKIPESLTDLDSDAFNFSSIKRLYLPKKYPANFIKSFYDKSGNLDPKKEDLHLFIEGKEGIVLPASISEGKVAFINEQFNLGFIDKDFCRDIYKYISDTKDRQIFAIKEYERTKDPEIGKYLRRSGKSIANTLVSMKMEPELLILIKSELITANTAKALLKNLDDMPNIKAYVLNEMPEKKTSFKL